MNLIFHILRAYFFFIQSMSSQCIQTFTYIYFHSVNITVLNAYFVAGSVLGVEDKTVNKTGMASVPFGSSVVISYPYQLHGKMILCPLIVILGYMYNYTCTNDRF